MGKGLGKLIGYALVILIIIYLLYTPPVKAAISDVQNLFSSGKNKVENFASDNKEARQLSKIEKTNQIPFPRNCREIRNIYEAYKDTFGTGNLTITGTPKTIGLSGSSEQMRGGRNFIGCNFTANNYSKGLYGVFEIVVQDNRIDGSYYTSQVTGAKARFTIGETAVNIIDTFEPIPNK